VTRALLAALVFLACAAIDASAQGAHDRAGAYRMLFTGDILLAREVAREIQARGHVSPWRDMGNMFKHADFVFGNLEGTVGGAGDCREPKEFCFTVDPRLVPLLKQAGFTAVGTANNHSGDLGAAGRRATREALQAAGMTPIGSEQSPVFFRLGAHTASLVNLSLVSGRDGHVDAIPSWQTAQKLRLARALADWVIVSVHWGQELADWVVPEQEAQAKWLVAHGADIIIGSHPLVVQPPACLDGRPVFYSLGNHVFDQKYAITKHGLIADCRIDDDRLTCRGLATETPPNSSFPRMSAAPGPGNEGLSRCPVAAGHTLVVSGQTLGPWIPGAQVASGNLVLQGVSAGARWRSSARALLTIASGRLAADRPPLLFTLERHPSPIDDEDGPRPYVYEMTTHGLVARWRGSALAWPLLDATLIADTTGRAYLCALHRGDSFLVLDDTHASPARTQVYAWNGFGFSGVTDRDLTLRCASQFGANPE
jgi:capsule synthesis protein PGA_cap